MSQGNIPVKDAYSFMSERLLAGETETNPYAHISFRDFVFDIYALSFPDKDFNTWHIEQMCEEIQTAFDTGKNLCEVMPRYHLKSTIGGHAVTIWRMLTVNNATVLYLSYKDGMARYHLAEIKKEIRDNPILSKLFKDLSSRSLATCRYAVPGRGVAKVLSGGILSFKRGIHLDGCVIVDDCLRDPQNPLNMAQLIVVEHHIRAEIANIPNKGIPMILLGTPMHAQDILLKLKGDSEYIWRFRPALKPDEYHEVLWEKQYPKEWLDKKAKSDWRSFQTEFLLMPATEIAAFFTHEELTPVLRSNLMNFSFYVPRPLNEDEEAVFAGYDVGKKRHPSHLVVLVRGKDGILRHIHQSFHDNIDYQEQARRLTAAVENFGIRKMLIDNTRAEMDERGLPPECELISMSLQRKKEIAKFFGKYVSDRLLELDDETRYLTQIVSVGSDLNSAETVLGHGESFWSTGMAILAHEQVFGGGGVEIGNLNFLTGQSAAPNVPGAAKPLILPISACPICKNAALIPRVNGQNCWDPREATEVYCLNCRSVTKLVMEVANGTRNG